MKKHIQDLCEELTQDIQKAYEETVSVPEAEKLAAKFLKAQLIIAAELCVLNLDARMKKSGTKAVKGAVYMEAATKEAKKPSDVMLEHMINMNELVASQQESFDEAECEVEALQNYLNIFKESHVYFRLLSKSTG